MLQDEIGYANVQKSSGAPNTEQLVGFSSVHVTLNENVCIRNWQIIQHQEG